MRWIDKPRKKTRREIVLEYIKFVKTMGYFDRLVSNMYLLASARKSTYYVLVNGFYHHSDIVLHNRCMIAYLETLLRNNFGSSLTKERVRSYLIRQTLNIWDYNESWDLTYLLMSYFKDKHIDNCIIVD
jgi:hypothetical protein